MPAQACSDASFATNVIAGPYDSDNDGYNDSAAISAVWLGDNSATPVHLSVTLEYANATFIDSNASSPAFYVFAMDQTFVTAVAHMGLSTDAGAVVFRAIMDETGAPCDWANYTYFLYPDGSYAPTFGASDYDLQVEENATVTFHVQVGNSGNLPDIINLTLTSDLGWNATVFPDYITVDPGNFSTVAVTVRAPHNAAPSTAERTFIKATSFRDPTAYFSFVLHTTVNAQVFLGQLSSAAPSVTTSPGTVAHISVTVTNAGNNHDVITVAAPAAAAGWAIALSQATFALDAGGSAAFWVNVTTPTALTGLLVWSPTINATAGDGTTVRSLTLEARLALPDFALAAADISVSLSHPRVGVPVSVIVTVHNFGEPSAANIIVSLADGTTNQTLTVSVGVSGTAIATFTWTALPGSSTLTATVDASRSVPEANEGNNSAAVTVIGDAPPTAAVANATASAKPGDNVTISAGGSSDADGTLVAYYFDFGDGANSDWVTTSSVTHSYAAAGTYAVKVRVRDDNGAESQNATQTVTIAAPAANPPTPGFDGAFAASAVALAAVGAVAWRARPRPKR